VTGLFQRYRRSSIKDPSGRDEGGVGGGGGIGGGGGGGGGGEGGYAHRGDEAEADTGAGAHLRSAQPADVHSGDVTSSVHSSIPGHGSLPPSAGADPENSGGVDPPYIEAAVPRIPDTLSHNGTPSEKSHLKKKKEKKSV
jgi:hypothetical protein